MSYRSYGSSYSPGYSSSFRRPIPSSTSSLYSSSLNPLLYRPSTYSPSYSSVSSTYRRPSYSSSSSSSTTSRDNYGDSSYRPLQRPSDFDSSSSLQKSRLSSLSLGNLSAYDDVSNILLFDLHNTLQQVINI